MAMGFGGLLLWVVHEGVRIWVGGGCSGELLALGGEDGLEDLTMRCWVEGGRSVGLIIRP
ncbi:unnamed protein product [Ilex paraguariensis]|uniref:Uncharacterized protein n=1 Tax=Ilex paraguariensis TaxID=185542 RepID=A0ABC8SL78_9AQUA